MFSHIKHPIELPLSICASFLGLKSYVSLRLHRGEEVLMQAPIRGLGFQLLVEAATSHVGPLDFLEMHCLW